MGALLDLARASLEKSSVDTDAETRRKRVLAMLDANTSALYALAMDDADADPVILTLAIRHRATCEFHIPIEKYDAFLLLTLIDRHGGTIH